MTLPKGPSQAHSSPIKHETAANLAPSANTGLQLPHRRLPFWYNKKDFDSDTEDVGHSSSFDLDLTEASTPLNSSASRSQVRSSSVANSTISFMSPMKRLDNLHLETYGDDNVLNDKDDNDFTERPPSDEDNNENDENDDNDDFSLGNQTITNDSDSEVEFHDDLLPPPAYISRKRKHTASPLDMDITPSNPRGSHEINGSSVKDMSGICLNNASNISNISHTSNYSNISNLSGHLKMSFSNSDSTPCPVQPRKKLKFKDSSDVNDITPTQPSKKTRKTILNFSNSVKAPASSVPLLSKLHDAGDDSQDEEVDSGIRDDSFISSSFVDDDGQNSSRLPQEPKNPSSTPISQSTPANSRTPSRAPSPPIEVGEVGPEINGYRFVATTYKNSPQPKTQFRYETPQGNRQKTAHHLRNAYNSNDFYAYADVSSNSEKPEQKYSVMHELPVSSAGLMDESGESLHVGDRRINDPYLNRLTPKDSVSYSDLELDEEVERIFQEYAQSEAGKLPLLRAFDGEDALSKTESLALVNDGSSVHEFFKYICQNNSDENAVLNFIKRDRLRWHPDKWATRWTQPLTNGLDKEVIDNLCQVLNGLVEMMS